jgi:DNA transformation protein
MEEVIVGMKGDQLTSLSSISAEKLQLSLSSHGDIRIRKMFGGYGVFDEDTMFALVDAEGCVFFKVDDTNVQLFKEAGSKNHVRMPYYRVPDEVLADTNALRDWAKSSITLSRNAK